MDWIFTFVRSSDWRRINTICYFAWKSYTDSRCVQLAFIPASYCWSGNHCSLSFLRTVKWPRYKFCYCLNSCKWRDTSTCCTSYFYLYDSDTAVRRICRTRGCCTSDRRQPWKSSWKNSSSWWWRSPCSNHVWHECCFCCSVWYTDGCCCLFNGNGQCRYHVLFRISPLCNVCADWCSPCFYVWCSCRKIYNCKYSFIFHWRCCKNSSSWNLMCRCQHTFMHYPS